MVTKKVMKATEERAVAPAYRERAPEDGPIGPVNPYAEVWPDTCSPPSPWRLQTAKSSNAPKQGIRTSWDEKGVKG